jgi:hypothetical protein
MTAAPTAAPTTAGATPDVLRMTPAAAQQVLRRTIPANLPVLLVGAPGVGKTAIVTELARELDRVLVVSHPVTSEPTDFRGLPWLVNGRATFLPIGDLARLADLGDRPAIWLIDDLGQAATATQAAVMQLVHRDTRALNGFSLPPGVAIVACSNRPKDRAGVGTFLAPLVRRFTTVLTIEPEPVSFVHWAIRLGGFNPLVASFLRWQPTYLLDETRPDHSLEQRCSPATWEHVSHLLALDLPPDSLRQAVSGAITPAVAIEFLAYLQVFRDLPNADRAADPDHVPLPDRLDATYATSVHLAMTANRADYDPFCRYVARLPPEFQLLFMLTATKKHPDFENTAAYIAWATRPETVALLQ